MNTSNLRNSGLAGQGAFEPINAPRPPPYIPGPAASNEMGTRHDNLPQFQDCERKCATAKAHLEEVTARVNEAQGVVSAARQQSVVMRQKCVAEREALAAAQKELGAALLANQGGEKIQRRVQDAQTRIDTLISLSDAAMKEMQRAEAALPKFYGLQAQAQTDLDNALLDALIAKYALLVVSLIPLAREISWRGGSAMTTDPGYLLDVKRPKIGSYTVADDGSLSFQR